MHKKINMNVHVYVCLNLLGLKSSKNPENVDFCIYTISVALLCASKQFAEKVYFLVKTDVVNKQGLLPLSPLYTSRH